MPPQPRFENSALLKPFIAGYDQQVSAYPIIEVHIDPNGTVYPNRVFTAFPAMLSAFPQTNLYPRHVLTNVEPYSEDQRVKFIYRIMPAPWVYDISTDKETLSLVFTKKRQNIGANIREFSVVKNGTGATVTSVLTAGKVSSATVSGGSGYADFFAVLFTSPGGSGETAQGYGIASNGVPASIFITQPGSAYGSPPTATAVGAATVEARRQDIDAYIAWEIINIFTIPVSYQETESIPVRYPVVMFPGAEFISVDGLGVLFGFRPAITRTTFAQVLIMFGPQIDGTVNQPPATPALANGRTVINPQVLWNPITSSFQSFFSSGMNDIITDSFTFSESRTVNNIVYTNGVTVAASVPTATQYVAYVAANNYVLYRCDSRRWHGNIYVTKLVYIPLL